MAKVVGPLMSIEASGTYGKTLVFSKWKGRPYVRELVTPKNPKLPKQKGVRAMMGFLAKAWAGLLAGEKDDYDAGALSKSILPFNEFVSMNLAAWQLFTSPSKNYPAEKASTPLTLTSQGLTAGVGMVTVILTPASATAIWGYLVFRELAAITAPSWADCVAVLPANGANAVTWVDTSVVSGTPYHYRSCIFNDDGIKGTIIADASVTPT